MLIHGDDDFVDVGQPQELFNALQRQGKDSEFVRYWGEDHTYGSPALKPEDFARFEKL